jgi:tetratricopeptide (TPR) repeat protein
MRKVFISYSHRDSEKGMKLHNHLKHGRIELFYDKTTIGWGSEWEIELKKGLRESHYLISCLSPSYLESKWCGKEVQLFLEEHGKEAVKGKLLPVLFEACPEPLPPPLDEIQYIDLSTSAAFDAHIFDIYRGLGIWPPLPESREGTSRAVKESLGKRFVGRLVEIWDIHDTLHDKESYRCILSGIGGVGKTQLAIEYVRRFAGFYPGGTLWIDAAHDPDRDQLDVVGQIQQQVKTPPVDYQLSEEEQVRSLLEGVRDGRPLLVVFDNYPEKGDLTRCFRYAGSGIFVLLTTRRIEENYTVVVKPMGVTGGREILNSHGHTFSEEADPLVERLGGLPLALELAGAYLKNPGTSLQGMLDEIDRIGEIDSCKEFEKEHRDSLPLHTKDITATFKISYDRIVSTADRDVMHCLCLLQPLGVPTQLIAEVLGIAPDTVEYGTLAKCIGNLSTGWGIISMDEHSDPVVHRLVRAYIEHRLRENPGRYKRFTNLVASALDHMVAQAMDQPGKPEPKEQTEEQKQLEQVEQERKLRVLTKILPHGEALCKGDMINRGQAAHILCNLGRIREMLGNKMMAVDDLELAVKKAEGAGDGLLKAKAQSYLGVSLFHMADFEGSRVVLASARKVYQDSYEAGGLDIDDLHAYGTCLDYIGENHREQGEGEYARAIEAHNKAIEVAQSAQDRRLRSLEAHATAQIGAIHLREKQYGKTIEKWKECLAIVQSEEVNDSAWIAHYKIDVGFVHLLNRNYEEAIGYLDAGKTLAVNGGFADNIARASMNLGSAYFVSGAMDMAREAYSEALSVAKENYVQRLIWRIEHNLGNVFRAQGLLLTLYLPQHAQGKAEKAMEHYTEALDYLEELRDNYTDDEKKTNFMEHRIRPYQTMIMLALDKNKSPEEIEIFGDSTTAEQYLKRGMHKSLESFYERALEGLDLAYESEKDKNFFVVRDRGYFIETE